ncbi:hypothetical protein B0H19DRAFT_707654 [Mycena capillaripes]|nr:hypothetical protein B0H19DRAFT_707654 [Mycena capillaripes]
MSRSDNHRDFELLISLGHSSTTNLYHGGEAVGPRVGERGSPSDAIHSQRISAFPHQASDLIRSHSLPALPALRYDFNNEASGHAPRPPTEQRVSNPETFSPSRLVPSFSYPFEAPAEGMTRSSQIPILRPNFQRQKSHSDDGLSSSPDSASRPASSLSYWMAQHASESSTWGRRLRQNSNSSSNSDWDSGDAGVSSGISASGSVKTLKYSPHDDKSCFLKSEASSRAHSDSGRSDVGHSNGDVDDLTKNMKTETFVIFSPHDDRPETPAHSFTTNDLTSILDKLNIGGCLMSVHEPAEAVSWMEDNWDHPHLTSIRDNGCGGPLAWMLSPTEPALAIFGSYTEPVVVNMAQALAQSSGFPVVIRPSSDNPALTLLTHDPALNNGYFPLVNHGGANNETSQNSEDESIIEDERLPEPNVGEGNNELNDAEGLVPDENASIMMEERQPNGVNDVARDGGDEDGPNNGPAVNGKWESPLHSIAVKLRLKPHRDTARPCGVTISYKFKFAIDPETEIPIDRADLTRALSQSEVIALIDLKIENVPRETEIDRSYASIGFLAHRAESIHGREFLPRGFENPDQIYKHGKQKQTQRGFQAGAGFSHGGPSANAVFSGNWSNGTTLEATDSKLRCSKFLWIMDECGQGFT